MIVSCIIIITEVDDGDLSDYGVDRVDENYAPGTTVLQSPLNYNLFTAVDLNAKNFEYFPICIYILTPLINGSCLF